MDSVRETIVVLGPDSPPSTPGTAVQTNVNINLPGAVEDKISKLTPTQRVRVQEAAKSILPLLEKKQKILDKAKARAEAEARKKKK